MLRRMISAFFTYMQTNSSLRYDIILRDGLPDWRQPVFYYRRVRKMGLIEFGLLIFLILTIGHYIVAWSIYLEKKFELVRKMLIFFILIDFISLYTFLFAVQPLKQMALSFSFSRSVKQSGNPCSWSPPVYLDLSTFRDWSV